MEGVMSPKSDKSFQEVATIKLTDEQRALLQRATGVALTEISVLEFTGESARALNGELVKAAAAVLGW